MSLREIHAETGIFPAHLSEIERGKRMVRPEQLDRLSEIYEVRFDDWCFMLVKPL